MVVLGHGRARSDCCGTRGERLKRILFSVAAVVVAATCLMALLGPRDSLDAIQADYMEGDLSHTIASIVAIREKSRTADLHLLAANCYRQLGQGTQFREQIEKAQRLSQSKDGVELAIAMYKIQHGQLDVSPQQMVDLLQNAGAIQADAYSVVVQWAFATEKLTVAKELIDHWRTKQPNSAQLQYLAAVHLNLSGLKEEAAASLIDTIERYPRHELSWLALAEVFTRPPNVRFRQSELLLERFASQFRHNTEVELRLAKIRRRLGHSRASQFALSDAKTEVEILERANVEFDLGNYRDSVVAFKAANLSTTDDFRKLIDAAFTDSLQGQGETGSLLTDRVSLGATALALAGDSATSQSVFELAANRTARLRRMQDLRAKQAVLTGDPSSVREMNSVTALSELSPSTLSPHMDPVANSSGNELYQTHCANCHGTNGDGFGRAASNLFPPPRRFRDEPMRMISSKNGLASDADLAQSIRRGQPGTSMPAFKQFSDSEVASLVGVLREFTVSGLSAKFKNVFSPDEETDGLAESQWVAARSQANEPIAIPDLSNIAGLAASGRKVFREAGCVGCHEVPGEANRVKNRLFDSLGRPLHPPNLELDAFHGGDEPEAIYKRITLGIPGTPHPALANVLEGDIESLVAYIVSLRTVQPDVSSNSARSRRAMPPSLTRGIFTLPLE